MGVQCTGCSEVYGFETPMAACPKCGKVHNQAGHRVEINPAAVPKGHLPGQAPEPTATATVPFTPVAVSSTAGPAETNATAQPPAATAPEAEPDNIDPDFKLEQGEPEATPEPAAVKTPCEWCGKMFVDVEHHKLHCRKKPKAPKPIKEKPKSPKSRKKR